MIAESETKTAPPELPKAAVIIGSSKIAGDVVHKATAELPDNQRGAIRRFHSYYMEHDLDLAEAGKLIRMDRATLSLVFRGKYPARLDNIVKEMEEFFDLLDRRSEGRKLQFIETKLTKKIWNVCAAAVEFQKIAFIFGDMQIGKSEALIAFKDAHNHGNTTYTDVPTGGALLHFLHKLAEIHKISTNTRIGDLRRRIIDCYDDRMLLIVDEIHRCIPHAGRSSASIHTIEFIRELYDEKKCGVVLCGTNVFREGMEKGSMEKILRQTKRRRLCMLQLPNTPTQGDLNIFAAAYGLDPSEGKARELEKRMVEDEALGMWLTLLRMGAKLAAAAKARQMNWGHVLSAHAGLQELERI